MNQTELKMATLPLPPLRSKHRVYAAFDGEEIVYVGSTIDTKARWVAHRLSSPWWNSTLVFRVLSEHSRGWLTAELKAIRQFNPKFNLAGTSQDPRRQRRGHMA